jgi:hypothetical protein
MSAQKFHSIIITSFVGSVLLATALIMHDHAATLPSSPDLGPIGPPVVTCQAGLPIGYLGQGTLQAAEAVSVGAYGRDTVLSTGPSSLIAEPLFANENFTGTLPASPESSQPMVPPAPIPGVTVQPVVVPSVSPLLRSCDYSLSDNAFDKRLASTAMIALAAGGHITTTQEIDTNRDTFMVADDPLSATEAIVIVDIPVGNSTPFPGGLPGTGFVANDAYAVVLSQATGTVTGLGPVPW